MADTTYNELIFHFETRKKTKLKLLKHLLSHANMKTTTCKCSFN